MVYIDENVFFADDDDRHNPSPMQYDHPNPPPAPGHTRKPSSAPSKRSSFKPSSLPTGKPTNNSITNPTLIPSMNSTLHTSFLPSTSPSYIPSKDTPYPSLNSSTTSPTNPMSHPTFTPFKIPSASPSRPPSFTPSVYSESLRSSEPSSTFLSECKPRQPPHKSKTVICNNFYNDTIGKEALNVNFEYVVAYNQTILDLTGDKIDDVLNFIENGVAELVGCALYLSCNFTTDEKSDNGSVRNRRISEKDLEEDRFVQLGTRRLSKGVVGLSANPPDLVMKDTCDSGFTSEIPCEATVSGIMTTYHSNINEIRSATPNMTNAIETAIMSEYIIPLHSSIIFVKFNKESQARGQARDQEREVVDIIGNAGWGVIAVVLGVFILVGVRGVLIYKRKYDNEDVSSVSEYVEEVPRIRETF